MIIDREAVNVLPIKTGEIVPARCRCRTFVASLLGYLALLNVAAIVYTRTCLRSRTDFSSSAACKETRTFLENCQDIKSRFIIIAALWAAD